jgi:hypothetical protein
MVLMISSLKEEGKDYCVSSSFNEKTGYYVGEVWRIIGEQKFLLLATNSEFESRDEAENRVREIVKNTKEN